MKRVDTSLLYMGGGAGVPHLWIGEYPLQIWCSHTARSLPAYRDHKRTLSGRGRGHVT